jgi:hypothetical protein
MIDDIEDDGSYRYFEDVSWGYTLFLLYIAHRNHIEVDEGASRAVFLSFLMAKALDQNSWMNGDDLPYGYTSVNSNAYR